MGSVHLTGEATEGDVSATADATDAACTGKWSDSEIRFVLSPPNQWVAGEARVTVTATSPDGSESDTDSATVRVPPES